MNTILKKKDELSEIWNTLAACLRYKTDKSEEYSYIL